MKTSRSAPPKSALGRLLAADRAALPILRRGGISASVRLEKDDAKLYDAEPGFAGAVTFSPHVLLKIPLTATQRDIRAAVKELLEELSGLRGVFHKDGLRAMAACLEDGRRSLEKIADPRKRRRALDALLARVAAVADLAVDKAVGELRRDGHAPYGSRTPTAAQRRARNRWIRRRYEELGREGLKDFKRCNRIRDELVALLQDGKTSSGRSSWKREPYPLEAATIRKIASHKRM